MEQRHGGIYRISVCYYHRHYFFSLGTLSPVSTMHITSPAFKHNTYIPSLYSCDGKEVSPALQWQDVPPEAASVVLIMHDPDVPHSIRPDGIWDHWLVWNIPPNITSFAEGTTPPGIQGTNTRGSMGYQGPCPPDSEHRYIFTLYALDTTFNLDPQTTTRDVLLQAMKSHILATAELVGRYERPFTKVNAAVD